MSFKIKLKEGDRIVNSKLSYITDAPAKHRIRRVVCKCDCGTVKTFELRNIVTGRTTACGCRQNVMGSGVSYTPLYIMWAQMKVTISRQSKKYDFDLWHEWVAYDGFKKWASENGYVEGSFLERHDKLQQFSPTNCHFVVREKHAKRSNPRFAYYINGVKYNTAIEAGEAIGVGFPHITLRCKSDDPKYSGYVRVPIPKKAKAKKQSTKVSA